jgi:hypothetical protein
MRSITVKVTDQAFKDARVWAAAHDTSVSAIVQYCIQRLPNLQFTTSCTFQMVSKRKEAPAKAVAAQESRASVAGLAANQS